MHLTNFRAFDDPGSKLRAAGYDTPTIPQAREDRVVQDGGVERSLLTTGGIINPEARIVGAGTRLLRFGKAPFVPAVAAGEWWLDWNNYKIVEAYADSTGKPITVAVRELCCVPVEWSSMTMVVQATAIQPLHAYEGTGAPAIGHKARVVLDGKAAEQLGLKQLFIPGLSDPDLRRDAVLITGYGLLPHELSTIGYVPRSLP